MEGSGERALGQDGLPCDWSKSNGANHLKSKNLCAQISSEIDELGYFVTVTEP